jgi:hypothetical protein
VIQRAFLALAAGLTIGALAVMGRYSFDGGLSPGGPIRPAGILDEPVQILLGGARSFQDTARITSEDWLAISRKFYPNRPIPEVSALLHHLLNWGPAAEFEPSTGALSGRSMVGILADGTEHPLYRPRFPLLYRGPDGLPRLARSREGGSETHPHQALATFALIGVRSSLRIRSGDESATVAELVDCARADLHPSGEIEWTTIALACYAPTNREWKNRWSVTVSFDALADSLLSREFGQGACEGTHSLHALAVMLSVDSRRRLLTGVTRERVRRRLEDALERLKAHQRTSGCWTPDWPLPLAAPGQEASDDAVFGIDRLAQATGHHLEWLDVASDELIIEPLVWRRAIEWCVGVLKRVPDIDGRRLCPYSHCFRLVRSYSGGDADKRRGGRVL